MSYCPKYLNTYKIFVTAAEIHGAISEIPRNKARGYDGLVLEHFQFVSHRASVELATVLKAFMRHGFLPDSLMLIMILPIRKSQNGHITSKDNYCPLQ